MPFLAIFRKDRDRDHSRAKTPVPLSPASASISSPKSSTHSHSRSRPSFASSRSRTSPPPQLADISPASDFDYILPEIDLSGSPAPIAEKVLEDPVKPRRALPFSKRRGSASSGVIIASGATTPVQRPFSEALDIYVRKTDEDRDHDRAADREATDPIALNKNNVSSAPSTPNTRQNTTTTTSHSTTLEDLDSDDDPLIPPPTRASVFGGYAYSDRDVPTRSQSLPDVDRDTKQDEMVRSDHGHARPARPQVHPHQLARGKNKSVDLNSLLASSTSTPAAPASASETPAPAVKPKKDTPRGLFGWRSKSSKETLAPAAPAPITTTITTDPADSSFSLKSFRHVGPASSLPSSPVAQPSSALGSSTNVNSAGMSANTSSTAVPPAAAPAPATANTPPSSYGRASPRPIPGRAGTNRERVNSTGSEGVMTAGLFRQGARRSNTNLVEDASTSPRSSMAMGVRDRDKRGPPTRTWTDRDGDGSSVSGSDRPTRPPRTVRLPENGGAVSDRGDLGLGHRPQRSLGRSTSAMVGVAGDEPSPFASALSQLGEESALARSGLGQGAARTDYKKFGVRSDSALRSVSAAAVPTRAAPPPKSTMPQTATSPESQSGTIRPGHQAGRPSIQSINVRPEMRGVNSRPVPQPQTSSGATSTASRPSPPSSAPSSQNSVPRATGPGPQGINSSSRPGPQSAQSSPSQPRSSPQTSSNKPRQSTPTAIGRSPIRTTIPTKTNDGPSIKPRASSPIKMARPPSPARSNRSGRSVSSSPAKSVPPSPTKSALSSSPSKQILSGSPVLPLKSSMRQPSSPSHSRFTSVDTFRAKSPSAMTRAMSPASGATSRAMSPASSAKPTPRTGYVPPPRQSSLAAPIDSDSDESEPEDVESESELGFGENKEVRALRGRGNGGGSGSGHGHDGLSRERTITQRTAGNGNVSTSGRTSPAKVEEPPRAPARHGVSLFDRPTPRFDKSSSSSLSDRHASSHNNTPGRTRASHSTSAISAAATARNAATLADANRKVSGHVRGASAGTIGRPSHIRSPAEGTDTDEDEDEKSETDSEDNAPLSALAPARRPGSSASSAAAPPMVRRPLVSMAGPSGAPPPRPPRRVPGVGVTRNSSLKGSRSVEDLGRMTMAPGSVVAGRPGPRPFVASPPSSTGDSSSGKAPLTPKDGSEAGGRRVGSSLGPAGDEARRKQRRRSEAKASVELGNVINGPGPVDDDEGERMAARRPQMGPGGMGMMGWNQPLFPHMTGIPTFPASHSMSFGSQFGQSMPFIPPPPPPGASEAYMAAHQQAVIMAKQAYLSAVAQQAVAFATEQWERSSNAGGSIYGGSQMSSMNMMGGPMMSVYANSAYAASAYEGSVIGGGWGSASAYGGGATRSVYGGGARSDYGGGMKGTPAKSPATPSRSRARAQTATAENLAPANRDRSHPMPPSTWNTRRKPGI